MGPEYIVPLITVFDDNGHVDLDGMGVMIEHVIRGGVDGILIMGSIGEFYAISLEERKLLIRYAVKKVAGRVKLLAGTSAIRFEDMLSLSREAADQGADGVMIISPYYFPLSDESVEAYYGAIAESLPDTDVYLYNFPDRTGYQLKTEVVLRLALRYPNIVGIKDTIPGMDHTLELIRQIKSVRPEFRVYSGFDNNFPANVRAGGNGCISGMANIRPELCSAWVRSLRDGDEAEAARIAEQVNRLMDIYFLGVPFVPYIKKAVQLTLPQVSAVPAFPLLEAGEEAARQIRRILTESKSQ